MPEFCRFHRLCGAGVLLTLFTLHLPLAAQPATQPQAAPGQPQQGATIEVPNFVSLVKQQGPAVVNIS